MGNVSHTTVSEILNGSRLSTWGTIRRLGEFLGADSDQLLSLWRSIRPTSSVDNDPSFDPFILNNAIVYGVVKGRHSVERTIERRVTATKDNVSHYVQRVSCDPGGSSTQIDLVAAMNCEIGRTKLLSVPGEQLLLVADVLLPESLSVGDSCVFTTTAVISAPRATQPTKIGAVSFAVSAQRVDHLCIRVQFEKNDLPRKCWAFPEGSMLDRWIEPPDDSDRILRVSRFGFVEQEFHNPARASTVAVVWIWT